MPLKQGDLVNGRSMQSKKLFWESVEELSLTISIDTTGKALLAAYCGMMEAKEFTEKLVTEEKYRTSLLLFKQEPL